MDRKILGLSGKLSSGKTTLCNWLYAHVLTLSMNRVELENGEFVDLPLVPRSYVNDQGKLMVALNSKEDAIFNVDSRDPKVMEWLTNNVWFFFKHFSLAEPLKDICVNILDASEDSIWLDKTLPTNIDWYSFPQTTKNKKTGLMTGRDLLEQLGTSVFRKLNDNCWAIALKNNIEGYGSQHNLVVDVRFENEVDMIRSMGGKIIRLTRTTEEAAANKHISNIALDDYMGFDYVLDNNNLSLEKTLETFRDYLLEIDWLKQVEVK